MFWRLPGGEAYALMPVAEDTEVDWAERRREALVRWRLSCLLDAGWRPFRAELLAPRFDIDLHVAVDLVRQGCDQKTALRILL